VVVHKGEVSTNEGDAHADKMKNYLNKYKDPVDLNEKLLKRGSFWCQDRVCTCTGCGDMIVGRC
jgi:hypothetical protein